MAESTGTVVATARLMAGVAEAVRKGFETFETANSDKTKTANDVVDGMTTTMEEIPKAARRFFDEVMPRDCKKSKTDATAEEAAGIDYERLAKLVAAELARKQGRRAEGSVNQS